MESQFLANDFRFYFSLLWRWAWLIVLTAVIGGVSMFVISQQMEPVYQASATLLINEAPGSKVSDYGSVLASQRLTETFAEMLVKKPVLNEVILHLELGLDSDQLKRMINVQPVRDTPLIEIKVEDNDPNRATAIANELGTVFSKQIRAVQEDRYSSTKESLSLQLNETQNKIIELETSIAKLNESAEETENPLAIPILSTEDQAERERLETILSQYYSIYASTLQSFEQVRLAEADSISNVVPAEMATPPEIPIRPQVFSNTAFAAIIGAMLAGGAIFLVDALDDTIRDLEEVTRYLQLPVLGAVRRIENTDRPITAIKPRAPVSEDFRSLRTNIQFASVDTPLRTILITSPTPYDGKTTVSVNLSIILTQGGRKVSLIDTDLRRPAVHTQMRLSNHWGLTSLFMNEDVSLDGILRKNQSSGLSVMTSGKLPPNPAELLGSDKMLQIISKIKAQSDIIIFDSPPLTAVTDSAVLSKRVDGVIIVINSGKTKVAAAQQAVEQLRRVGANIIGIVLNNVGAKKSRYYATYYSYYSDEYYIDYVPTGTDDVSAHEKVRLSNPRSNKNK